MPYVPDPQGEYIEAKNHDGTRSVEHISEFNKGLDPDDCMSIEDAIDHLEGEGCEPIRMKKI
jgi:hypothetical protein